MSYERATFHRPFDHSQFDTDLGYVFIFMNLYEQIHLTAPISSFYKISDSFILGLSITPHFGIWKSIKNSNIPDSDPFPLTKFKFDLHSVELTSSVGFKWKKSMLNLNCRLINFQKIDKIIFYSSIQDPRGDQKFDLNNPLKINLTYSYFFN